MSIASNTSLFRQVGGKVLCRIMPRRAKRMIFIASAYAYLRDLDTVSPETLHSLNQVLHLARDEETMKIPLMAKDVIWKDLDEDLILPNGKIVPGMKALFSSDSWKASREQIIQTFIDRAPSWMIYGPRKTIERELDTMLQVGQ